MNCLSSSLSTKPLIFACLSNNTTPLPPHTNPNHSPQNIKIENDDFRNNSNLQKPKQKQKQALSVAEIERVIGAGAFRDRDISSSNRNAERGKTLFDTILSKTIGESEGKVERKLRETGEWINNKTEKSSNSTGKNIILFAFLVVLPLWILSFLVASQIITLPFDSPYLDDLIK